MRKLICLCSLVAATPLLSQTLPAQKQSFEVASIKLGNQGKFTRPNFALDFNDLFSGANPHGRFFAEFPLAVYVEFAYKLWPSQELREAMLAHLPKWVSTDKYAINAVAEGNPTKVSFAKIASAVA
jgi:hypothetical protein